MALGKREASDQRSRVCAQGPLGKGFYRAWPFLKHTQICESCEPKAREQLACRGHVCLAVLVLSECPSAPSLTARRSCAACFPFLLPAPVAGCALRMIKWLCGWPHPVVCVPGEGVGGRRDQKQQGRLWHCVWGRWGQAEAESGGISSGRGLGCPGKPRKVCHSCNRVVSPGD